jgi:enoyl-CoA hydratase/carnithine racemase
LGSCFVDIARDPEIKVVVFTGTGADVIAKHDMQDRGDEATSAEMWERIFEEGVALLENHLAVPVPMIAAVNGPALMVMSACSRCSGSVSATPWLNSEAITCDIRIGVRRIPTGVGTGAGWFDT